MLSNQTNLECNFRDHFLKEGELFITSIPYNITTVLGSCVSVCLWDREKKIAGMNHYILPCNTENYSNQLSSGTYATKALIKSMLNRQCNILDIEAKVFGGSNFIKQFEIGKLNLEVAYKNLSDVNIPIIESNTGGINGRKIIFNTFTGKVTTLILNN